MFRVVSPVLRVYDDGAVEAILEHVFEAVDLEVILSLLTKLDVQPNWCGAGAQRIDACERCKQRECTHGCRARGGLRAALPAEGCASSQFALALRFCSASLL